MSYVASWLRDRVIERAGGRCEYCRLSQVGQEAVFHVDHVFPVADGGPTVEENLALACVSCSLHKSARRFAEDPETEKVVALFNPRDQVWAEHFAWQGLLVQGLTQTGRATVAALAMNHEAMIVVRSDAVTLGRHPPP